MAFVCVCVCVLSCVWLARSSPTSWTSMSSFAPGMVLLLKWAKCWIARRFQVREGIAMATWGVCCTGQLWNSSCLTQIQIQTQAIPVPFQLLCLDKFRHSKVPSSKLQFQIPSSKLKISRLDSDSTPHAFHMLLYNYIWYQYQAEIIDKLTSSSQWQ